MNPLETLIVGSILGGTVLVPFVDLVNKDVVKDAYKFLIALVSSVFFGTLVYVLQAGLLSGHFVVPTDSTTWYTIVVSVFGVSQTVFNLYWKTSLLREKLTQQISPTPVVETPIAETGETHETPADAV